jgi:hypothetical protein
MTVTTSTRTTRMGRNAEIVAMRRRGHTLQEIADDYGLTREAVRLIVRPHVTRVEAQAARDASTQRLVEMYRDELADAARQGKHPRRVARELGLPQTVTADAMRAVRMKDPRITDASRERHRATTRRTSRVRYSDEDVFAAIRRAAEILGRTPGHNAYDRLRAEGRLGDNAPTSIRVIQRYGWCAACAMAGLAPNARPSSPRVGAISIDYARVSATLQRIREQLGYRPSMAEYDRLRDADDPSANTLRISRSRNGWTQVLAEYCG